MAIVYQKDAGLGQGITALGQALSQGISQFGESQYKTALQRAMDERKERAQEKQAELKYQNELRLLQDKEALKNQGFASTLENLGFGRPQLQEEDQFLGGLTRQSAQEEGAAPTLKEKFKTLPDENAPPSQKYALSTDEYGPISRAQIDGLLIAPNESARKLGESLDKRWTEQYKLDSKENAEIRKEYRNDIRKYSEPYQDVSKLQINVEKLNKAKELIASGKVSVDDNFIRNAVAGILEGHESPIAELVKTPEQQQLWYLLRDSLKPKEIGGSNPSTREVLITMSAQPGPYKGQAANEFIIQNMINQSETELFKANKIRDLRSKNESMPFPKFLEEIDRETTQFMQEQGKTLDELEKYQKARERVKDLPEKISKKKGMIWVMSPDGKPLQIPIVDLKRVLDAGGKEIK